MSFEKRTFEEEVTALKESMKRAVWQGMTTFGFDNSAGTRLHFYQVEYCYLIDSIERDSRFVASKQIPKVRELISNLRRECAEAKEVAEG